MGDEDTSTALERLKRVTGRYLDRDLTPEEVEQLAVANAHHIFPLNESDISIFILGSYDDGDKWKLELVKSQIQDHTRGEKDLNVNPFLMEDIPGGEETWINLSLKFRILADVSDVILGVVEHDSGGFVFEQGIISSVPRYRERTVLLKREYDTKEQEHEHYSAMQSAGLFSQLDTRDDVLRWSSEQELISQCENLVDRLYL